MNLNTQIENSIKSIHQSIGISNIKRAMHQDSTSIETIKKMSEQNKKIIENTVTSKGNHIDINI